ncbi:MAG: methyltransferase [Cytophagales bacterium]|nr:MAG: methyltransferase [Cytophagales bacterium]TAF60282.1 MAG: methyltransferase [Cytophagales bacterium]
MNELQIVRCQDGSQTIYDHRLRESYHSLHGAREESLYVYIQNGLTKWWLKHGQQADSIRVFEVGFGTGLNVLLAEKWAAQMNVKIELVSVELWPLSLDLVTQLDWLAYGIETAQAQRLHQALPNVWVASSKHLSFYKIYADFTQEDLSEEFQNSFDVLFYDAFAPRKQPSIWQQAVLQKAFRLLRQGGLLSTYTAQGRFRRDLSAVGFEVEKLKGAVNKKEMTCAWRF